MRHWRSADSCEYACVNRPPIGEPAHPDSASHRASTPETPSVRACSIQRDENDIWRNNLRRRSRFPPARSRQCNSTYPPTVTDTSVIDMGEVYSPATAILATCRSLLVAHPKALPSARFLFRFCLLSQLDIGIGQQRVRLGQCWVQRRRSLQFRHCAARLPRAPARVRAAHWRHSRQDGFQHLTALRDGFGHAASVDVGVRQNRRSCLFAADPRLLSQVRAGRRRILDLHQHLPQIHRAMANVGASSTASAARLPPCRIGADQT